MNPEHVRVLVARRMQQATEALEDGKYLLAAGRGARTALQRILSPGQGVEAR
jgi:hypothetical protein